MVTDSKSTIVLISMRCDGANVGIAFLLLMLEMSFTSENHS